MSFSVSSVAVLAAVVFFVSVSCGDSRKKWTLCDTDDDCVNATSHKLKCCVQSFTGTERICRTLPNELGSYCGGLYFCDCDPRKNLTCDILPRTENLASTVASTVTEPSSCSPPAVGICIHKIADPEFNQTNYTEYEITEK